MGFVSSSPKIILEAYYTQLGRYNLINGTSEQSMIKYFSINDPDVNYLVAVNINGNDEKNILPTGFVVDLTGDKNDCIKSVSAGVNQKNYLDGYKSGDARFVTVENLKRKI